MNVHCDVAYQPIGVESEINKLVRSPEHGGQCLFEGIVRNHNLGRQVTHLEYEVFKPLAVREFTRICHEAFSRFSIGEALICHREGTLEIEDTAVVVIALARHRDAAFLGCRYMIDELKKRAPIWKQEFYEDGSYSWPRCSDHHHRNH